MEHKASPSGSQIESPNGDLGCALKSRLGLELPSTMRRIAARFINGESLEQIAGIEALRVSMVKDYLGYVVRTLRCEPIVFPDGLTKSTATAAKKSPTINRELGSPRFMVKAKCEACGKGIEGDAERIIVSPVALTYHMDRDDWGNHEIRPYSPPEAARHYCLECIHSIEEFRLPNPWLVNEEERRQTAKWIEAREHDTADREAALQSSVANGDMRTFNQMMPTRANPNDVMARSVPVSRVAAQIAERNGGDDPSSAGEIAESILSNHGGWRKVEAAQAASSGEGRQRTIVLEYLNSPQSKGKMLPAEREAAKMYAAGLSENEIARKQGVNQSTVHRRIDAVRKKARAAR